MKDKNCQYYCFKNTRKTLNKRKQELKELKLVVFDMDGVLTDINSSWSYVHDYFDTSNDKSVDDYLRGKIDDLEFIRRDVGLWKVDGRSIKKVDLERILSDVPIIKGAKETVDFLKKNNVKTCIVSAGIDILARRVAVDLDIDHFYANGIETDSEGFLNGKGVVGVSLLHKDRVIEQIIRDVDVGADSIISVGNSCLDIPMFNASGLGVAFNPEDDCVQDAADVVVREKDLRRVIPVFKRFLES